MRQVKKHLSCEKNYRFFLFELCLHQAMTLIEFLHLVSIFWDLGFDLYPFKILTRGKGSLIPNCTPVGADLCVCPEDTQQKIKGEHTGSSPLPDMMSLGAIMSGEHIGSPLHAMIQWFKTMITNGFIWGGKIIIGNRIKIMATQLL